jgi:hypothetical protein
MCTTIILVLLRGLRAKVSWGVGASTSLALKLLVVSFAWAVAGSSTMSHFSNSHGRPDCSLRGLQHDGLSENLIRCLLAAQSYLLFQTSVPYAVIEFQLRPSSHLKRPSFRGSSYNIVLAWSLTTGPLARCRNGMVGQPSSGSGKLLLAPTIALSPFLRRSAGHYD